MDLSRTAKRSNIDRRIAERINLAVHEWLRCAYCVDAHTRAARKLGLSDRDIQLAREGTATDPKIAALVAYGRQLIVAPAEVSDAQIAELREYGYSDEEIAEVVALVALQQLSGAFNLVAGIEPSVGAPLIGRIGAVTPRGPLGVTPEGDDEAVRPRATPSKMSFLPSAWRSRTCRRGSETRRRLWLLLPRGGYIQPLLMYSITLRVRDATDGQTRSTMSATPLRPGDRTPGHARVASRRLEAAALFTGSMAFESRDGTAAARTAAANWGAVATTAWAAAFAPFDRVHRDLARLRRRGAACRRPARLALFEAVRAGDVGAVERRSPRTTVSPPRGSWTRDAATSDRRCTSRPTGRANSPTRARSWPDSSRRARTSTRRRGVRSDAHELAWLGSRGARSARDLGEG